MKKLEEEILGLVDTKFLEYYDKLMKWDSDIGPAKVGANRFPYCKDYKIVKTSSNGAVHYKFNATRKIAPIFWPNQSKELQGLFRGVYEDVRALFMRYGIEIPRNQLVDATESLIITSLESDSMDLPSPNEITENVKNNIDGFIKYAKAKYLIIRSIAPLIGCSFDESISLENIIFRSPTLDDYALMTMVSDNFFGNDMTNPFANVVIDEYRDPVLVIDHEFRMITNPNDWSVQGNMERLHGIFKEKCRDVLACIRIRSGNRIGINRIYHKDSSWTTYDSFRHVTEDPSHVYRPVSFGRRLQKKDEFTSPLQELTKQDIAHTFSKIREVYHKGSFYTYLIEGIDNYSKSFEEYELRWQLLHLVIAMECLGFVSNGIKMNFDKKGRPKMCDTADKIIEALDITSAPDRNLITKAYRLRSNAGVTHISSFSPNQITMKLIADLRKCERDITLKLIEKIN